MSEALSVITFSTSIADQEAPKPLPVGQYPATVEKCEGAVSKNTGKPMLVTTFNISADDYPPDYDTENAPDGTLLTLYVVASDDARSRYRMRKHCETMGVAATTEVDPNEFIGLNAMLTIEHEDYEGAPQARIKSVDAMK